MKKIYYVPLLYWYETRIKSWNSFLQYIIVQMSPIIFFFSYIEISFNLLHILSAYMIMLIVYEFGYFVNDFISLAREQKRGFNLDKTFFRITNIEWIGLLLIRLITLSLFFYFLDFPGLFYYYLLLLLSIFLLHDFLFYPIRFFTFWTLYFVRYAFPFALVPVSNAFSIEYILFILFYSFAFSISYSMQKRIFSHTVFSHILPVPRAVMLTFVLLSLGFIFSWVSIKFIFLITIIFSYFIMVATIKFIIYYFRAKQDSRTFINHSHTYFSHDAEIPISMYAESRFKKVFLTDHAEDFDEYKYSKLREEANIHSKLIPGLEFSIENQHILSHNLKNFIDCSTLTTLESLETIKKNCDLLILAHPVIPYRKVFKKSWLSMFLIILTNVDGIEVINYKTKSKRHKFNFLMTGFFTLLFLGNKKFYVGVDTHKIKDLHFVNNK